MEEYNISYEPAIFVTDTKRTQEEQNALVKAGKSKTYKSNHLTGTAVDIAFKGKVLYPTDEKIWSALCFIMRKYGIVNWYYDLKRGFDKVHFQDVDVQAPTKLSASYVTAKNWKSRLKSMMRANSSARHRIASENWREKLHERNNKIRELFDKIWEKY